MEERGTGPLGAEELRVELARVVEALRAAGEERVVFEVGWGAAGPVEELWREEEFGLEEVMARVEEGERRGEIRLGMADVTVRGGRSGSWIRFTHHGFVCVGGEAEGFRSEVVGRWREQGKTVYERVGGAWRSEGSGGER